MRRHQLWMSLHAWIDGPGRDLGFPTLEPLLVRSRVVQKPGRRQQLPSSRRLASHPQRRAGHRPEVRRIVLLTTPVHDGHVFGDRRGGEGMAMHKTRKEGKRRQLTIPNNKFVLLGPLAAGKQNRETHKHERRQAEEANSKPARTARAHSIDRSLRKSAETYSTLMFSTGVTADGKSSSRLSSRSSSSCARLRV
jgi:hypothetical protein